MSAVQGVVPGVMKCAKCGFSLTRVTLFLKDGTAAAGDNQTEPCPNGCGPLWPETWEQAARSAWADFERLFDAKHKAEQEAAALRADAERYREALQFYARPEHWMALTDDADADRILLVAHSHLEASGNGWSVAMGALMGVAIAARKQDTPCGECHLKPGEVCDVCGARAGGE